MILIILIIMSCASEHNQSDMSCHYFGPGGLHAPPMVAEGSEGGHCFSSNFSMDILNQPVDC